MTFAWKKLRKYCKTVSYAVLGTAVVALCGTAVPAPLPAPQPAPQPAPACITPTLGCWKQLPNPEVTSVNMIGLKNGYMMVQHRGFGQGINQQYQLFKPGTDVFFPSPPAQVPVPHNMYCSGFDQTQDDGDVLFAGGLSGNDRSKSTIYDPDTDTWTAQEDMAALRFYPSVITLSDHENIALGGTGSLEAAIPEIFQLNPSPQWRQLFGAELTLTNYPFVHVISTGGVIFTGSRFTGGPVFTQILDPLFETWTQPFDLSDPIPGKSAVMYDRDTIMKAGPLETWTLDATTPGAEWTQRDDFNQSRNDFYLTALADGTVFASGSVVTPEIYDPDAGTWTEMAAANEARFEHSSTALLPDARVLTAGSGFTAEVYSPPYLFNSNGTLATRPKITAVSGHGVIQYGQVFKLSSEVAALVQEIRLTRLGAATHNWDMGQQSTELNFAPSCCDPTEEPGVGGNSFCIEGHTCCADGTWKCNAGDGSPTCVDLTPLPVPEAQPVPEAEPVPLPNFGVCDGLIVDAPQHPYQTPPGYHYLFILVNGVPSRAAIVELEVCP